MPDYAVCLQNARKIDPNAKVCIDIPVAAGLCQQPSQEQSLYKYCHCLPPYAESPCTRGPNSPQLVWYQDGGILNPCYCCCSCFAWGTPIMVPTGQTENNMKSIQDFEIGDDVMAAGADLQWTPYEVEFSEGIPPGPEYGKPMFTIYYVLNGALTSLVVTPDHVFFMPDKQLKRAENLVVGKDRLTLADGSGDTQVLGIEVGMWFGGVHHISTDRTAATSLNGHLLASKGVVTGDWSLQVADLESGKVAGARLNADPEAPVVSEQAYVEKHGLSGTAFSPQINGVDFSEARPKYFAPFGIDTIPDSARTFITEDQALDIEKNAKQAPPSSNVGREVVNYLFKAMKGFYPDVHFVLRWEYNLPNAYSWDEFGVKFIVLNGGLARIDGVGFNELAIILSHEVGHLYGGDPTYGPNKYSCEGQSDYAATAAVIPTVFYITTQQQVFSAGVTGINNLFSYISKVHRHGTPGDTCNKISIDCRMEALMAGVTRNFLPTCAGGPETDYLELLRANVKATPGQSDLKRTVMVVFDQELNWDSADHPQYYTFTPEAEVMAVEKVGKRPDVVSLSVSFQQTGKYKLTVQNVMSASGSTLKNNTATVKVKW